MTPGLGERTYERALLELADADPRIVVMTAENRAPVRGLPTLLGERFVDVGIAEQTLVGAAAGLALAGRIPIVHGLAAFLTMRAFEFARTDVGVGGLPVTLVGTVPGFLSGANGPTHQAVEDVALMRQIPGMRVFCPADAAELVAALPDVVHDPHPWYVRLCDGPPAVAHEPFVPGRAEIHGSGVDVALVTAGLLLETAVEAARLLARLGISARVVNLRTLSPVDEDALVDALAAGLCVTLEDHLLTGGIATILAETALRCGVTGRHLALGLDGRWFEPAPLPDVLAAEGFTPAAVAGRIAASLSRETS